MANLGNTIINGILRVNGKVNSSDVISAPSFTGALTGNADTATKLKTARTINGVSFDGTKNITVADSTKIPLAGSSAITGNLAPKTTNTLTLGTSSLKWSGIYTSQINGQNVLEYEIVDEW